MRVLNERLPHPESPVESSAMMSADSDEGNAAVPKFLSWPEEERFSTP